MDSKHAPLMLVAIVSLGFFGLMAILAFHTVPAENKDTLVAMVGVLSTAFGGIVGYYFGSSANKTPPTAQPSSAPIPATPAVQSTAQEGQ